MKFTSAAQMREMDRQTIEDFGLPSIVLMENAAHCVLEALLHHYWPLAGKRIEIVCGKGNNGGDGLVVARHLAARYSADVTVWMATDPAELRGDAATNYTLAHKFGLKIERVGDDVTSLAANIGQADLVIDALLGTGLKGAVTGPAVSIINAMNDSRCPILSIDIPSGLQADTGTAEGVCVLAQMTVTFALPKYGQLEFPGVDAVGKLVVGDIGMPRQVMDAPHVQTWQTDAAQVGAWLPSRRESRDNNKGKFGHLFVFAGSKGYVGAPTLTAEGAARAGAGLVTLVVPEEVQTAITSRVSPVIMTKTLPQTSQGTFDRSAAEVALKLVEKADAAAIGPGLGGTDNEETCSFVRKFVADCPVPLLIDADALNILSAEPDHGTSLIRCRRAPTVLTPHPGEMGRLIGMKTADVQADRRAALQTAKEQFGCVILLKGSRTLVSGPDDRLFLNTTGNSGMATGGMGDTLSGIIGAFLAAKLDPTEAAAAGAYVHGLAGDLAAADHGGKAGLIATDIIDVLPRAIAQCEKAEV